MLRSLLLSAIAVTGATAVQASRPNVVVPAFPNAVCPVMGKPASLKLFVDTPRGRIYVCCVSCNKKIRADPESMHKSAYPEIKKLDNVVCPVSGKKLLPDSPRMVLQRFEFGIFEPSLAKAAADDSQWILTHLTNPKATAIGNETCPVTGKPTEKLLIALVGDEVVRLSSMQCVEELKSDPERYVQKAKDIAKQQKSKAPAGSSSSPEKEK